MLKNRRDTALESMVLSGIAAVKAKNTPDEIKAFRRFFETVKNELIYYIYPRYDNLFKDETAISDYEQKRYDIALEQYNAVVSNAKFFENVVCGFDEGKVGAHGFQGYFLAALSHETNSAEVKYNNSQIRLGLNSVFTEKDTQLLKKIANLIGDDNISECDGDVIALIAECVGVSVNKVAELLAAKRNSYCTYFELSEEGDYDIYEASVSKAYDDAQKIHRENSRDDADFIRLLEYLNTLHKTSFSEKDKRIFPPAFTGRYIDERAKTVMQREKIKSRAALAQNCFELLDLPLHRDLYANGLYLCMLRALFDYSIENRVILTDSAVADLIGVKPSAFSKTVSKIYLLISQRFKV